MPDFDIQSAGFKKSPHSADWHTLCQGQFAPHSRTDAEPKLKTGRKLASKARLNNEIDVQIMEFLRRCISMPSVSGGEKPFVKMVADQAARWGLDVDVFQTDENQLPLEKVAIGRHLPLTDRPTAVITLRGQFPGKTLLFNAHSDVVDVGDENRWRHGPWSGTIEDGRMFGRGACDAKGPLVAGLGAMLKIRQLRGNHFAGSVALELIPGEENCVDLGTLTSVARGYRADAAIVLEPTESLPCCASRSGLRFEISIGGHAVHGTVKWLGRDAIKGLRQLLGELDAMENHFSRMESNELFADYPLQRPITVDRVSGGEWQGMICDHVLCAGYFELCPGDDLDVWQERFTNELKDRLAGQGWPREAIDVDFSERYSGFSTTTTSSICRAAEMMIRYSAASGRWKKWRGFNSGCEGGLRFALHGTPTLVWGPGSLAQAHRVDEYVPVQDVMDCSNAMAAVALAYLDIEAGADIVSRAGN